MVFDFSHLYEAYLKESLGKRDKPNHDRYTYELEDRLFSLAVQLSRGSYKPAPLQLKDIRYPKKRVAQVPSKDDKIVQHAICDNVAYWPLVSPLSEKASANTRGRGTDYGLRLLKDDFTKFYRKYRRPPYILKCDISNFFGSIPHDRAKELVRRYISDETELAVLDKFIDLTKTDVGLPLGLQQSQLIANLYLSDMDHMIIGQRFPFYGRHMDDFYIMSDERKKLEDLLEWIDSYVESIGLKLNPKTVITYRAAEYLGFKVFITDSGKVIMRLLNSKKKTKRRQLRKQVRALKEGKITPEKLAESYHGWRQFAQKGDTHNMIKAMDEYFNNLLEPLGYHMRMEFRGWTKNRKKWRTVIERICNE